MTTTIAGGTKIEWADRTAEQTICDLAAWGLFVIDQQGRIWRQGFLRYGRVYPCAERRAENRTSLGYLQVRALIANKRVHAGAHRVVWTYFNGPIPEGAEINHRNGVRDDNRPENLEPLTASENVKHAFDVLDRHRTTGESNGQARLTADTVLAIRVARLVDHRPLTAIAAEFGVTDRHVSAIALGKRWAEGPWPSQRVREFPRSAT